MEGTRKLSNDCGVLREGAEVSSLGHWDVSGLDPPRLLNAMPRVRCPGFSRWALLHTVYISGLSFCS